MDNISPIEESPQTRNAPSSDHLSDELDPEEAGVIIVYDSMPFWLKAAISIVVVLTIAIILAIFHDHSFRWFESHTGIDKGSGPWYSFWSGFGSDLGEVTIFAGAIAIWRHHSCHVRGCMRVGRSVAGTTYIACPKHNPDHKGNRRSIALSELIKAHKEAKES